MGFERCNLPATNVWLGEGYIGEREAMFIGVSFSVFDCSASNRAGPAMQLVYRLLTRPVSAAPSDPKYVGDGLLGLSNS